MAAQVKTKLKGPVIQGQSWQIQYMASHLSQTEAGKYVDAQEVFSYWIKHQDRFLYVFLFGFISH